MIHPQQPSGMPVAKYVPFQDQIPFALPDPSIVEVFAEAVMPKAREL